jgi:hypothetical protein
MTLWPTGPAGPLLDVELSLTFFTERVGHEPSEPPCDQAAPIRHSPQPVRKRPLCVNSRSPRFVCLKRRKGAASPIWRQRWGRPHPVNTSGKMYPAF